MQMTISQLQKMWMVDYGPARARAIGWLGQRYLLATPVNRVPAMDAPTSGRLSRAPSLGMSTPFEGSGHDNKGRNNVEMR